MLRIMRLFLWSIILALTVALPPATYVSGFTIALQDYDGAAAAAAIPAAQPDAARSTMQIAERWSIDPPTLAPFSVQGELRQPVSFVAPGALSAGSPGRVVANALEPHELAQVQSIVDFRGVSTPR